MDKLDGEEFVIALGKFIVESNQIEGISSGDFPTHMGLYYSFLDKTKLSVKDFEEFVSRVEPGAVLRENYGQDVTIRGNHVPPRGSPYIREDLSEILEYTNKIFEEFKFSSKDNRAWVSHIEFERLHPFTDGNGRAGRLLWLWTMHRGNENWWEDSFLKTFYFQTIRFKV